MTRWPEQGLTAYQLVGGLYTKNDAYQKLHGRYYRHRVEVGKFADLVVLDTNILEVDPGRSPRRRSSAPSPTAASSLRG